MSIDLEAIKARAEAATRGPWTVEPMTSKKARSGNNPRQFKITLGRVFENVALYLYKADADFIVHSREDIPALLAEVERLNAAADALAAYEDTGLTPEEVTAVKERTADAWLQLRTATFSTDKGAADLAKFILSILPEVPKKEQ